MYCRQSRPTSDQMAKKYLGKIHNGQQQHTEIQKMITPPNVAQFTHNTTTELQPELQDKDSRCKGMFTNIMAFLCNVGILHTKTKTNR